MDKLNNNFIELLTSMGKMQGLDDLTCRIFGILYSEPKEIAMDDLIDITGYSLSSISNKINIIQSMGILKKIKKPGSKKVYVYMQKDIIKILEQALVKKKNYVIDVAKEKLPEIIKEFKEKSKSQDDKKRLKVMEDYYGQIMKFDILINNILKELEKIK